MIREAHLWGSEVELHYPNGLSTPEASKTGGGVKGALSDIGLGRRLLERKNCNIQPNDSNDRAPQPLPMPKIESDDSAGDLGRPVILGIEKRHDNN
jgi:hypothetical protein